MQAETRDPHFDCAIERHLGVHMRRRRNQTPVDSPRLLARFLNHACEMAGVTQTEFVKHTGPGAAPATVSRLFRGEVAPTERDLEAFSQFLKIPIDTLRALRMLESVTDQRMLAASGLTSYMVSGEQTSTLLMAGFTMGLGIGHLRAVSSLARKTVLVDILAPKKLAEIDDQITHWAAGDAIASWVSVGRTLARLGAKHHDCRIRLWTREAEHLDEREDDFPTGEVVANDWFAIEAPPPYKTGRFQVHFYGDARWSSFIGPLIARLSTKHSFDDHSLIWDSADAATDSTFRSLLSKAAADVSDLAIRPALERVNT